MNKKTIIIGMNVFVAFVLLSILIYPLKPEINWKERDVKLRWLGVYKNYTLYVDDNNEFTSPIVVDIEGKEYMIELEPGVYFWKVKGGRISSPVKKLILDSDVSMRVKDDNLKNDGNVDLNINVESVGGAIAMELPYKEQIELEDKDYNITAEQK